MKLIVGLGNPGSKYEKTWHNVGFFALEQIADKKPDEFSKFKNSAKFKAEISENNDPQEKIILARPQTYMNNSGDAVKSLMSFYKIEPQDLWVVHDDVDLPLGKIRISNNSSAGGHKGVQSVIDQLGYQDFVRLRIGIQPVDPSPIPTEKYVLQKIGEEDKVIVEEVITKILAALEVSISQGITEAMNQFN